MPTAAEEILSKAILPTALSSREMRKTIGAGVLRRSLVSARTAEAPYLARLQELLAEFAEGRSNRADFVKAAQDALAAMGYDPAAEGAPLNSMRDRGSAARLSLILRTQVGQARSVARMAASWKAAGEATGWVGAARGALVALKGSPIWAALGRGEGGWGDTLGNPFPPFAFNSGMEWFDAPRATCARLGLVDGDAPPPSDDTFATDLPEEDRQALLDWASAEDMTA